MLKPVDIQSKEFEIKLRGYDREEVDDFLDQIIADMTVLYKDNTELTNKVRQLGDELASYRAREAEINQSLELANYRREELKKNAQLEAKDIIQKARTEAESILHNIENNKLKMKAICTELLEKINNM